MPYKAMKPQSRSPPPPLTSSIPATSTHPDERHRPPQCHDAKSSQHTILGSIGTNTPYHGDILPHFALKADDSGDGDGRVGDRANRWEGRNGGPVDDHG
eukprot:CAMPEP_0201887948 /NCGR_PEP_ID=MMETSP0902-20130614/26259_1 /ASSEMBLY_ACC=CAM_ASM_000551 /TAXON_ID=420261 /ORGANISM="Thalassiosira antarctica, Strain CCMP982" /LENGTH=98 /DNA_ID=CAMNT_0048418035 /DNA_START=504 /DNA_END=801 /DNA_ORIENTATION=-